MTNSRHQFAIHRVLLTAVLAALSLSLSGCGGSGSDCEPIDVQAYVDPMTPAESSYEGGSYFNLTEGCHTGGVACQEYLPATCEEACRSGLTCIQVELRIDPCPRNFFFPDTDTGDQWIRRCLEFPNGTEVPDFSGDDEEDSEAVDSDATPELPEPNIPQ